jgi:hypothetical protein
VQLLIAAIILMVTACLALLWSIHDGMGRIPMLTGDMEVPEIFGQKPSQANIIAYFVLDICVVLLAPVVIAGAIQMLRRRTWGFTRFAAIIAMLPLGTHCCCVLGLPIGIWAFLTLNRPDVRAAFEAAQPPVSAGPSQFP